MKWYQIAGNGIEAEGPCQALRVFCETIGIFCSTPENFPLFSSVVKVTCEETKEEFEFNVTQRMVFTHEIRWIRPKEPQ